MKKIHELTDRQIEILSFIYAYRAEHGFAPSIREIGQSVGIRSTSAVSYQINKLVTAGYLGHTSEVARSFVLLDAAHTIMGIL